MIPTNPDAVELFRAEQRARVSRWIRNSEAGWLFYDNAGTAWHLLGDEATELESQADHMIGRTVASLLDWPAHMAKTIVVAATALAGLCYFGLIEKNMAGVVWVGAALLVWVVWLGGALMIRLRFGAELRNWQRRISRKLKRDGRGGVPSEVAAHHRRYNLFKLVSTCSLAIFLARTCWTIVVIQPGPPVYAAFTAIDLALVVLAAVCGGPSLKIDATHRRRKWFD